MTGRVLIIDDEADVRRYLSALLEDQGCQTLATGDAEEGRRLLVEERPDLVLLDLVLPGRSGVALYREMREDPALRGVPVVVVTGIRRADAEDHLGFGGTVPPPEGYIEKPLDRARLLEAVRALLLGGTRT